MAFYSTEKPAVVLDIGSTFIRAGLAGELDPRTTSRAALPLSGTGRCLSLSPSQPGSLSRGSDPEWKQAVLEWLTHLLTFHLQVDPRSRRLVVCEDVSLVSRFRNALAHVALAELGMVSIIFVPGPAAALLPLGIPTALVIDIGGAATKALPVVDSLPLIASARDSRAAGHLVDANIARLLAMYSKSRCPNEKPALLVDLPDEDDDLGLDDPAWTSILATSSTATSSTAASSESESASSGHPAPPPELVEDLKVKACFVALAEHDTLDSAATPQPDTETELHLTHGVEAVYDIRGCVRSLATQVLFQTNNAAEIVSLPELVLDSLASAPVDIRGTLAQNILVVGGSALFPGLLRRLSTEMDALLTASAASSSSKYASLARLAGRFRFIPSSYAPDTLIWSGGSLIGSMIEYLPQTSVSRDEYLDNPRVPDWSRIGSKAEFAHFFHDM